MVPLTWVVLVARGPCVVVLHAVIMAVGVYRNSRAVQGPARARRARASFTRRQGDSALQVCNILSSSIDQLLHQKQTLVLVSSMCCPCARVRRSFMRRSRNLNSRSSLRTRPTFTAGSAYTSSCLKLSVIRCRPHKGTEPHWRVREHCRTQCSDTQYRNTILMLT